MYFRLNSDNWFLAIGQRFFSKISSKDLPMACFVVTQHSESARSLCLRYSKTSCRQATQKTHLFKFRLNSDDPMFRWPDKIVESPHFFAISLFFIFFPWIYWHFFILLFRDKTWNSVTSQIINPIINLISVQLWRSYF